MRIGTKSVLFGAHAFYLHPWFVAAAWWKLFGFPWDIRLWFAFAVHDLGYLFLPNMDGPEGEEHPRFGAKIMGWLFDWSGSTRWHDFCLYHSRYFSKKYGAQPSKLCFADKLSFCLTPRWLYLPMVTATGEINEYLKNAQTADSEHWKPTGYDKKRWHAQLKDYMRCWVYEHLDGSVDTWTNANRHATEARNAKPWGV
jgi:hypothetical protein